MTRERIATLSFLVMESLAWFMLAAVLAGAAGGDGPAYPAVLIATLGGFGIVRALLYFDVTPAAQVIAGAAVSVVVLLVLVNTQYHPGGNPFSLAPVRVPFQGRAGGESALPQIWGTIVLVAAWFRSVQVAQQELSYTLVLGSFSVEFLGVVALLLFGQGAGAGGALNFSVVPVLLAGLFTLALIQLRRAALPGADFLRGPWLPVMLGTIGGLAAISALIGIFPLDILARLLALVGSVVLAVLDVLIYAIALPIAWLIELILSPLLGREMEPFQPRQGATDAAERLERQAERSPFIDFLTTVAQALLVLALLALVAYVLYRVFRALRRPRRSADEVRESVYAEGSVGDDLGALLHGLLGRFRRGGEAEREPPLPAGILRLRRLYLRTLDRAAARGVERPLPATPHEFSPTLSQAFGTPAPDRLSDRFAAGRYGRVEPTREELAALEGQVADLERHV